MPFSPFPSSGPPDEPLANDRLIPFPARSQSSDSALRRRQPRRRPEPRDVERSATPRRARRRRHNTPWLQRNALSIAAISFLGALLGLGFGLTQVLTRPDATPAMLTVATPEQSTTLVAASLSNAPAIPLNAPVAAAAIREIHAAARIIEPNYTVEPGDTLGRIATRYNTTVDRILVFNSQITDPRSLRIGARLVIPPPL
jgi:hypothetical protein